MQQRQEEPSSTRQGCPTDLCCTRRGAISTEPCHRQLFSSCFFKFSNTAVRNKVVYTSLKPLSFEKMKTWSPVTFQRKPGLRIGTPAHPPTCDEQPGPGKLLPAPAFEAFLLSPSSGNNIGLPLCLAADPTGKPQGPRSVSW